MRQHLLQVAVPADELDELIAAVRHEGERVGWLELPAKRPEVPATRPDPIPPALAAAAERGVLRAVAVAGGRSVAVKPMVGEPVLRDLLREHFRGCLLVLVRGGSEAPRLESRGDAWVVATGDGEQRFTTAGLDADAISSCEKSLPRRLTPPPMSAIAPRNRPSNPASTSTLRMRSLMPPHP